MTTEGYQPTKEMKNPNPPKGRPVYTPNRGGLTAEIFETIKSILDRVKEACSCNHSCVDCPFGNFFDCDLRCPSEDWEGQDWYKKLKKEVECSH